MQNVKNVPVKNNIADKPFQEKVEKVNVPEISELTTDKEIKYGASAGVAASLALNDLNKKKLVSSFDNTNANTQQNAIDTFSEEYDSYQMLNKVNVNNAILESKKEFNEKYENSDSNIKPSCIKLKTINNKEYSTSITSDTKPEDLSDIETLDEMEKRQTLIKQKSLHDGQFKKQEIILENGDTYNLNASKHNAKLTPQGVAYMQQIHNENNNLQSNIQHSEAKSFYVPENLKFVIIVPPKPSEDLIVETGKQNHLLIGTEMPDGNVAAIGYLTSKKSGTLISEKQYKEFQKEKEMNNEEVIINEKQQFLVRFTNINIIEKINVKIVKYSEEYIQTIPEETKDRLKEVLIDKKTCEIYDNSGVTKPLCIEICKRYDIVAQAKKDKPNSNVKHPLTEEQIKINKQNQDKQRDLHDNNKLNTNIINNHESN